MLKHPFDPSDSLRAAANSRQALHISRALWLILKHRQSERTKKNIDHFSGNPANNDKILEKYIFILDWNMANLVKIR
jgi:hypothetical protein